jgi:hypothetical protein
LTFTVNYPKKEKEKNVFFHFFVDKLFLKKP